MNPPHVSRESSNAFQLEEEIYSSYRPNTDTYKNI